MTKKVRVRFAPSPTGPLHIGGVRTALYNYLFAKQYGGDFLLRIEDTDQTRFVEGAEDYIRKSLEWLGILPNEGEGYGGAMGPYKQSERKALYQAYIQELIGKDWAYYAFDTPEELDLLRKNCEAKKEVFSYDSKVRKTLSNSLNLSPEEVANYLKEGRKYVVRFKMPENKQLEITDMVRGVVRVNTDTLDDKVLFKSDGLPTYHFANIVDDHLMQITHVIRGEEWLPSMPLHVLLYQAFGWEAPQFAHLALLLKPEGKGKLSKRDGDKLGFPVSPLEWIDEKGGCSPGYKEAGYLPEAVVNMLALLGWNPGTEQEIFTLEELVVAFNLDKVSKSGARFSKEKAIWFNHHYLQKRSNEELASYVLPILEEKGIVAEAKLVAKVCGLVKERINFPAELWGQVDFFFEAPTEYDATAVKKMWKPDTAAILSELSVFLETQQDFQSAVVEEATKKWIAEKEIGMGKVLAPLRIALVGGLMGPHVFDIMEIIGLKETLNRLEKSVNSL